MHEIEKLNKYEWLVVVSLILLLAAITIISHRHWFTTHSQLHSNPLYLEMKKISVHIQGAVQSPGVYELERGAVLKDLLDKSVLAQNADIKTLDLMKKLKDGQMIKVPSLHYITVYLKGAVKHPGALLVPKGSSWIDLLEMVEFLPGADFEKLKRKKRLKDGEVIQVNEMKLNEF